MTARATRPAPATARRLSGAPRRGPTRSGASGGASARWSRAARSGPEPGRRARSPGAATSSRRDAAADRARQRRPSSPARPRLHRGEAALAEAIARGEPLEQAVCRSVTALTDATEWHAAWSLAEGVVATPAAPASAIGHRVIHHRRRQFDRVWTRVAASTTRSWRLLPIEAVDGGPGGRHPPHASGRSPWASPSTTMAPARAGGSRRRFLALVDGNTPRPSSQNCAAAGRGRARRPPPVLVEPDRGLARPPAGERPGGFDPGRGHRLPDARPRPHVGQCRRLRPDAGDARQPRPLSDVTFTGDDGLGASRPSCRRGSAPTPAHRSDGRHRISSPSIATSAPPPTSPTRTWMIAFGWHMHSLYDLRSTSRITRTSDRCSSRSMSAGSRC